MRPPMAVKPWGRLGDNRPCPMPSAYGQGGGAPLGWRHTVETIRDGAAMDPVIRTIVEVLLTVLNLYQWVFIISAVMSWLIAFGVVNTYNRFVNTVVDITGRLTEPLLRPIRRVVPDIGGVDISFIVAILILFALQRLLVNFMAYSAF